MEYDDVVCGTDGFWIVYDSQNKIGFSLTEKKKKNLPKRAHSSQILNEYVHDIENEKSSGNRDERNDDGDERDEEKDFWDDHRTVSRDARRRTVSLCEYNERGERQSW